MSNKVAASETSPPPTSFKEDEESLRPVTPYAFLFLSFLCLSFIYANILTLHSTVGRLHGYGNGSDTDFYNVSDYRYEGKSAVIVNVTITRRSYLSNPQKEILITVVPIGSLLFLIPLICIYNKFGFCRAFLLAALISIVLSLFIPICTNVKSYVVAIMVRIVQGFSLCAFIPFMGKLCGFLDIQNNHHVAWMMFSYLPFAGILTFPIGGLLAESKMGWHSVHYFYDGALFVLTLLYLTCHYSEDFKYDVHDGKWTEIFRGHSRGSRLLTLKLPYLSIYQDIHVWGIFIPSFAFFSVMAHALQDGPVFFDKVLDYNTVDSGLLSAIAPFFIIILGFLSSRLYDRLSFITEDHRLRMFNSASTVLPGIIFILITFINPRTGYGPITVLYIIATSLIGFAFGGIFRMCQLRAKQFHVFLLFHLFIVQCVAMFLTSLLNSLIIKSEEYNAWRPILIVQGGILLVGNALFCLFATSEPAKWTKDGYEDTSMRPKRPDPLPQFPL